MEESNMTTPRPHDHDHFTNVNPEPKIPNSEDYRLFASISYLCLVVIGLGLYAVFLKLFVKHYTVHFSQHPFYVLVQQLAVADVGFFFELLLVAVPCSFVGRRVWPDVVHDVLVAASTLFFFALTFSSFLIAVNRLAIFVAPGVHDRLFHRPAIYLLSALIWTLSLAVVVISTLVGCPKDFKSDRYHHIFRCASGMTALELGLFKSMLLVPAALGVLIVIIYAFLFVFIRRTHNTTDNGLQGQNPGAIAKEIQMVIQGTLIGCSLTVQNLSFNYVPKMFEQSSVLAPIVVQWSSILNSILSPVVLLLFNKTLRGEIKGWLKIGNQQTVSTVVAMPTTGSQPRGQKETPF